MEIHLVQESNGSLPECPEVFFSEAAAEQRYITLINKAFSASSTTLEEAEVVMEENEFSSYEVRIWATTTEDEVTPCA